MAVDWDQAQPFGSSQARSRKHTFVRIKAVIIVADFQ
jgi:hypothetical protein